MKMCVDFRAFLLSWRQLFQRRCHWTGWWWLPCLVYPVSHHWRSSEMQEEMKRWEGTSMYFSLPLTPSTRGPALFAVFTSFPCSHWETLVRRHNDRKYWSQPSWFVRLAHSRIALQDLRCALWFGAKTRQPKSAQNHLAGQGVRYVFLTWRMNCNIWSVSGRFFPLFWTQFKERDWSLVIWCNFPRFPLVSWPMFSQASHGAAVLTTTLFELKCAGLHQNFQNPFAAYCPNIWMWVS